MKRALLWPDQTGVWRAALQRRYRYALVAAIAVFSGHAATSSASPVRADAADAVLPSIHGLVVGGANSNRLGVTALRGLKAVGINTLLVDQAQLTRARSLALTSLATRIGFRVYMVRRAPDSGWHVGDAARACESAALWESEPLCAVRARLADAASAAQDAGVAFVTVPVSQPGQVKTAAGVATGRARVVVVFSPPPAELTRPGWSHILTRARAASVTDFAFGHLPVGASGIRALARVTAQLVRSGAGPTAKPVKHAASAVPPAPLPSKPDPGGASSGAPGQNGGNGTQATVPTGGGSQGSNGTVTATSPAVSVTTGAGSGSSAASSGSSGSASTGTPPPSGTGSGGSGGSGGSSGSSSPSGASVWVTPTGNDATCARSDSTKPCGTLLKAYKVAQCGDTVTVADGTYSASAGILGQGPASAANTEAKDCSAGSNPVAFVGASASGVNFPSISVEEPWVSLSQLNANPGVIMVSGWDSNVGCFAAPVTHVTVADARTQHIFASNVAYVTFRNNDIGGITSAESEIHNTSSVCSAINNHITLTGNTFHDYLNIDNGATHMECLQIDAGVANTSNTYITITGNRFQNCGQYDFFGSGDQENYVIANNWFDAPCSAQGATCSPLAAVAMGPTSSGDNFMNLVVMFNSFAPGPGSGFMFGVSTGATMTGNLYAYNIDPASSQDGIHCGALENWVHLANYVAGSVTCPGDVHQAVTYAAPAAPSYDLDLVAGSTGIPSLAVCPASAPATDIHGKARPTGGSGPCTPGAAEP